MIHCSSYSTLSTISMLIFFLIYHLQISDTPLPSQHIKAKPIGLHMKTVLFIYLPVYKLIEHKYVNDSNWLDLFTRKSLIGNSYTTIITKLKIIKSIENNLWSLFVKKYN